MALDPNKENHYSKNAYYTSPKACLHLIIDMWNKLHNKNNINRSKEEDTRALQYIFELIDYYLKTFELKDKVKGVFKLGELINKTKILIQRLISNTNTTPLTEQEEKFIAMYKNTYNSYSKLLQEILTHKDEFPNDKLRDKIRKWFSYENNH